MIQDIYFRFYDMTHLHRLSIVLSYMARFVFFLSFLMKRIGLKREILDMTVSQAIDILHDTSPEPTTRPEYTMVSHDESCDLSIIVPVYNHIDVLKRCIDSLVNQKTRFHYELLLIDDGSTDGAEILVDRYGELEDVVTIHQENRGIAGARNTGINHARGRYLMFVDCDDYVHENLVESLMSRAMEDDSDIVMCAHALVKVKDGVAYSRLPNIYPSENLLGYKNGDEIMNYPGLPWGKVYRRQLFEKVRFFPGYWYEDTIIHSMIFTQCHKYAYIPEVMYEYQWHESNFSHIQGGKNQNRAVERYWLLKAILERCEEIGLDKDAEFYTMVLKHVSAYYYPTISSLPKEVVDAMFVAGRELLIRCKPEQEVRLPYMLHITEKAILDKDISLWKLCSVNQ